jgi:hypothetical protein
MKTLEQKVKEANEGFLAYEKMQEVLNTLKFRDKIELERDEEGRGQRLDYFLNICYMYSKNFDGGFKSDLMNKIDRVKDHKGGLEITWRLRPTEHDKKITKMIWEEFCFELSDNVEHYLLTPVEL